METLLGYAIGVTAAVLVIHNFPTTNLAGFAIGAWLGLGFIWGLEFWLRRKS